MLFGAQNVEVSNPECMSGGFDLGGDVVLPYNRVVIIFFAAFVVFLVWLFLSRTRLGLYVRAVNENRTMADCMGIPTPRVDWLTFGLGSVSPASAVLHSHTAAWPRSARATSWTRLWS